jgi:hypothetical protein
MAQTDPQVGLSKISTDPVLHGSNVLRIQSFMHSVSVLSPSPKTHWPTLSDVGGVFITASPMVIALLGHSGLYTTMHVAIVDD